MVQTESSYSLCEGLINGEHYIYDLLNDQKIRPYLMNKLLNSLKTGDFYTTPIEKMLCCFLVCEVD